MRYGIPEYKLEKATLNRRLAQMPGGGNPVRHRMPRSASTCPSRQLRRAVRRHRARRRRAARPGTTEVEGRELNGVHLAMEHLVPANKECEGDGRAALTAAGKHVVIIGGGDTGADCLGTAHRQGAIVGDPAGLQPGSHRRPATTSAPRGPPGRCVLRTLRRRTPRAGPGTSRWPCSGSSATNRATCGRCRSPR